MAHLKYLTVGAGLTADTAARGIRESDPDGSIAMIGDKFDPPYSRPPLSKDLWKRKPIETIWRRMEECSTEVFLGRTARSISPQNKEVLDDRQTIYSYENR